MIGVPWRWIILGAAAAVLTTQRGRGFARRFVEPSISFGVDEP